eukprot:171689_1
MSQEERDLAVAEGVVVYRPSVEGWRRERPGEGGNRAPSREIQVHQKKKKKRAPKAHPFDYDYVDEVSANLQCIICLSPLVKPKVAPCQHTFCKLCILTWFGRRTSKNCPMCRKEIHRSALRPPSIVLSNILAELRVRCVYRACCDYVCARSDIKDHVSACFASGCARKHPTGECPLQEIECAGSKVGCKFRSARESMSSHEEACAHVNKSNSTEEAKTDCSSINDNCATSQTQNGPTALKISNPVNFSGQKPSDTSQQRLPAQSASSCVTDPSEISDNVISGPIPSGQTNSQMYQSSIIAPLNPGSPNTAGASRTPSCSEPSTSNSIMSAQDSCMSRNHNANSFQSQSLASVPQRPVQSNENSHFPRPTPSQRCISSRVQFQTPRQFRSHGPVTSQRPVSSQRPVTSQGPVESQRPEQSQSYLSTEMKRKIERNREQALLRRSKKRSSALQPLASQTRQASFKRRRVSAAQTSHNVSQSSYPSHTVFQGRSGQQNYLNSQYSNPSVHSQSSVRSQSFPNPSTVIQQSFRPGNISMRAAVPQATAEFQHSSERSVPQTSEQLDTSISNVSERLSQQSIGQTIREVSQSVQPVTQTSLPSSRVSQPAHTVCLTSSRVSQPVTQASRSAGYVSQTASPITNQSTQISLPASRISQRTNELSLSVSRVSQPTSRLSLSDSNVSHTVSYLSASRVSQPASNVSQTASQISQLRSQVSMPASRVSQPASQVSLPASRVSQPASQVSLPASRVSQ